MNNALTVIEYILNKFVGFIFNDMKLNNSGSVTFGWVLVVLIIFGILIGAIVAVPHSAQVFRSGYWRSDYAGNTWYHKKGNN